MASGVDGDGAVETRRCSPAAMDRRRNPRVSGFGCSKLSANSSLGGDLENHCRISSGGGELGNPSKHENPEASAAAEKLTGEQARHYREVPPHQQSTSLLVKLAVPNPRHVSRRTPQTDVQSRDGSFGPSRPGLASDKF